MDQERVDVSQPYIIITLAIKCTASSFQLMSSRFVNYPPPIKITVNRTQVSDNSNTPQGISNFRPNKELQGHDKNKLMFFVVTTKIFAL